MFGRSLDTASFELTPLTIPVFQLHSEVSQLYTCKILLLMIFEVVWYYRLSTEILTASTMPLPGNGGAVLIEVSKSGYFNALLSQLTIRNNILQVETKKTSFTGWSLEMCSIGVVPSTQTDANFSRISTGALLWFNPMRTMRSIMSQSRINFGKQHLNNVQNDYINMCARTLCGWINL